MDRRRELAVRAAQTLRQQPCECFEDADCPGLDAASDPQIWAGAPAVQISLMGWCSAALRTRLDDELRVAGTCLAGRRCATRLASSTRGRTGDAPRRRGDPRRVTARCLPRDRHRGSRDNRQAAAGSRRRPNRTGGVAGAQCARQLRVATRQPIRWRGRLISPTGIAAIEVYPGALLKATGGNPSGYKEQIEGRAARGSIAQRFAADAPWLADLLDAQTDVFDAALCVLAGLDFLRGNAEPPTDRALAERKAGLGCAAQNQR